MKTLKLKIYGKVQGVFFRESTKEEAKELGVNGWVRNESDGSVLAVLQGEDETVDKLADWCHHGPEYAEVDKVLVEELEDNEKIGDFQVRWN